MAKIFDPIINFFRKFPLLKKIPIKFYRFLVIGLSNFVIDFIIFNILFHVLQIQTKIVLSQELSAVLFLANIISVAIASVFGYYFNRSWTFENKSDNVASQYSKYLLVAVVNIFLNNLIFGLLVNKVFASNAFAVTTVSKVMATSFQVISSYLLYKYVVFRQDKETISEATVGA